MPYPLQPINDSLHDEDLMVRHSRLAAPSKFPEDQQLRLAQHLLADSVRDVRVESGCALTSVPVDAVQATQRNWMNLVAGK